MGIWPECNNLQTNCMSWQQSYRVFLSLSCNLLYTIGLLTVVNLVSSSFVNHWAFFEDAPFIPSHEAITCYQWTSLPVECSKQVFFFFFDNSTTVIFYCYSCLNLFETYLSSNSELAYIYKNQRSWSWTLSNSWTLFRESIAHGLYRSVLVHLVCVQVYFAS